MNIRVYQTFFFSSDIFSHQKKKQIKQCNCNVLIFRFNLIPNTIGLLLKKNECVFFITDVLVSVFGLKNKTKNVCCSFQRLLFSLFSRKNIIIVSFRFVNAFHALKF